VQLPFNLENKSVYLPVKVMDEEAQGVDFLVQINAKAAPKSMISRENLNIIPILAHSDQKQPSSRAEGQISIIETQDAQDLWVGMTGGECQSLPMDEGGVEMTCDSSWQLLRSQSGGWGWETISLPGGISTVSKSISIDVQPTEVDPKAVQPQADTWVRTFIGHAFDKCEVPTLSQLQTWYNSSPYKAVNLYIGGISRRCANSALSTAYLQAMHSQGWKFIPTWVGPQAPCSSLTYKFPYDVNLAYQAGVDNANLARTKLMQLGLSNPMVLAVWFTLILNISLIQVAAQLLQEPMSMAGRPAYPNWELCLDYIQQPLILQIIISLI
jgi:hypothetical protein